MRFGHFDDQTPRVRHRPDPTPRCPGSTISAARSTSASSPTPPAATPSIATPGCAGSPAIAITTRRSISAGAISTCGTTRPGLLVAHLAADAHRARRLRVPARPGLHAHQLPVSRDRGRDAATSCRWARTWRSGGCRVTNRARSSRAELSLFSSIEFCLWDAQDDATNFQRNFTTGQVEVEDGVIYHKTEYRERRNHFAYFACSEPLAGFDTQREAFLGPYRGWDSPAVVERGRVDQLDRPRLGTASARTTSS